MADVPSRIGIRGEFGQALRMLGYLGVILGATIAGMLWLQDGTIPPILVWGTSFGVLATLIGVWLTGTSNRALADLSFGLGTVSLALVLALAVVAIDPSTDVPEGRAKALSILAAAGWGVATWGVYKSRARLMRSNKSLERGREG